MNTPNWFFDASRFETPRRLDLKDLPVPAFPKPMAFPSVDDLAAEQAGATVSATKSERGLFQELLLSRPEGIYEDAVDHPEKYAPEVLPLTRELLESRREPTTVERAILDAAVLDLMKTAPKPAAPPPTRAKLERAMPILSPPPAPVPISSPAGEGEPQAFWWL